MFQFRKSDLTAAQIAHMKRELTFQPPPPRTANKKARFAKKNQPYKGYAESAEVLQVPRLYPVDPAIQHLGVFVPPLTLGHPLAPRGPGLPIGKSEDDRVPEEIALYEYQKIARDIILDRLRTATITDPKGAVLTLPCGFGKTRTAEAVVTDLGVKALWLTTIRHLATQACNEMNRLSPQIRTASLPKKPGQPLADADMYFGTLQSIYKRRYPPEFFASIGLVIVDECHHLAAPTHAQTMCLLPCARFLGLTATPERKDLREQLIYYLVGDSAYRVNRPADGSLTVRYLDLPDSAPLRSNEVVECGALPCYQKVVARKEARDLRELRKEPADRKPVRGHKKGDRKFLSHYNDLSALGPKFDKAYGELGDRMELLGELANYQPQNRLIIDTIVGLTAPEVRPRRGGILVLGKLITHLQVLAELFARRCPIVTWALFTGEESAAEQAASIHCDVLFATFDLVKEGFDLPRLDTLILASPAESLVQCVGRIQRKVEGVVKMAPVVYDMFNDSTAFNGETRSRLRQFAAMGARLKMPQRGPLVPQGTEGPSAGSKRARPRSPERPAVQYAFNFE